MSTSPSKATQTVSSQTKAKLTPMMEQYRSIRQTLSDDTVLFFRMGDFYEMFFEDAVRVSDILNITLTARAAGAAGKVPMCGFPAHAFGQYVRQLLDQNLKVAICEQIGDPKAAKGLVERKITRFITPATYLDEEVETQERSYVAAVVQKGKVSALAALDLGTGRFFIREFASEKLVNELTLLHPREVILPASLAEDPEQETFVREALEASITVYEDWVFDAQEGVRQLCDNFNLASERAISFHEHDGAVSVAGAVLYYLKDHLHEALGHIQMPVLHQDQQYMPLDRQTLRSLELVSTLNGQKQGSLLSVLDKTLTSMGSRTLHDWVTHPLLGVEPILERQTGTAELVENAGLCNALRQLVQGVRDIERTLSRLNYGVANARDLLNLRFFLEKMPELKQALSQAQSGIVQAQDAQLQLFPELQALIEQAIDEAPPLTIREGEIIRSGYSKDLDELRQLQQEGKDWLLAFQKREMERTGIKNMRVRYSQVFGYTIEVSKANLNLVPEDYIRRQTLANAERFVVPELKAWDEKISGAQDKIKQLEYELFLEVRAQILEQLVPLQAAAKALGVLDALGSLSVVAQENGWTRPEVNDSLELVIREGRHPVVEGMLPAGEFVANDTHLDGAKDQLIVLTGPNMAGKSTTIRQVALISLLAQMGAYVPAAQARVGWVDRIFTRIGAQDDLARGESTFMVEMIEMAHILQGATDRSLVILDEVGRGTSTFDGVSLAWAICEFLVQGANKPRTLFATHYHELVQLEQEFDRIRNYTVAVKETKQGIVFLRKVIQGGTDRSYGIHVAQLAGIPVPVIKRAQSILKILEKENTKTTELIEAQQERTLFDIEPEMLVPSETHPLIQELKQLKLEQMTPLEALNKLSQLQRKAEDEA